MALHKSDHLALPLPMITESDSGAPVADIGVIGLAVMGKNLILNMNDNGFVVCAYNRTVERVVEFLQQEGKETRIVGASSLEELVSKLKIPRRILLMVKSGHPVDDFISQLLPHLANGDILIDGGNSNYLDTERRVKQLASHPAKRIHFIGCGISGGEEGARYGPSIMPGGSVEAWHHVRSIFKSIAAKAPEDLLPCCEWIGNGGAGHFVKMVHNGIEYADMQVICEAYDIMRKAFGMDSLAIAKVFEQWNEGKLGSFLVEICAKILSFRLKGEDGKEFFPVEQILDVAGQKGTGKLTVQASLEYGVGTGVIAEAVYARVLSGMRKQRENASSNFVSQPTTKKSPTEQDIQSLCDAVYASKIVAYTQGFMLLNEASKANDWALDFQNIAAIWRNGCIIRSAFLNKIMEAYAKNPTLDSLLSDQFFVAEIGRCSQGWRRTVSAAVCEGIPIPGMSSALTFFDSFRSSNLPVNLLQAMRDYFGAHTFEYKSAPGIPVHIQWTATSGKTCSSTYNA